MDARTTRIYQRQARDWIAARRPRAIEDGRLARFVRRTAPGALIVDLGSGPGWNAEWMSEHGRRVIALDASTAMLADSCASLAAHVCADLAALPLRDRSLSAAWANACYQHLPTSALPLALAQLHWALIAGAPIELTLAVLDDRLAPSSAELARGEAQRRSHTPPLAGRLFSYHSRQRALDLMVGAGFERVSVRPLDEFWWVVRARRALTLPDMIAPGLRLLICGLNPSIYSAERGIGFARPGNRFWPAMIGAGLVERERDPRSALARGIGMTDIVKRPTVGADELSPSEYAAGLQRLERVVRVQRPRAICFVGLDGWRKVIDRRAMPGWQPQKFGGRPAYLMPSTSGRNARVPLNELIAHLREAATTSRPAHPANHLG